VPGPSESHTITWTGGDTNHDVKIEYSTDNGSSYKTIVDKTPNTGIYNWSVPAEISPMFLIRISDPAGKALALRTLTFGFNIKAEPPSDQTGANAQLGFRVSLPFPDAQVSLVADLTIIFDSQSLKEKTNFNLSESELRERHIYSGDWHSIQIRFNIDELTGTLLVDGLTILEGVPLIKLPIETSVPELALLRDAATSSKVWLDDFEVDLQDKTMAPDEGMVIYKPIVRDLFDAYKTGDFPGLGGWLVGGTQTSVVESETDRVLDEKAGDNLQAMGILLATIDDSECFSPRKALELKQKAQDSAQVHKSVSLPVSVPFDVSLTSFAIASGIEELEDSTTEPKGDEVPPDESSTSGKNLTSTATNPSNSKVTSDNETNAQRLASITTTLSDPRVGCYYIYTFDGRPLAEYDIFGNCLKDYIYMGGRLVAEYDPAVQQYFYYTLDHIGSTRVVTNDGGIVVYAEAHDPYGGIQQTWPDSFNPTPEFAGKERDDESMMDYFGARYYSSPNYRWVSVDPALSKDKAIMNPQLWNLYSFCANNPVSVTDPNGESIYGSEEAYGLIQEIFESYAWMLTRDADGHIRFIHAISDEDISQLAINHPELQELILAIMDTRYKILFQTGDKISTSKGDVPIEGPDDIAIYNDWRKGVKLPPAGYGGVAAINEAITVGDPNDVKKNVSPRATAFHVLLEVIGHVAYGMQAYPVPRASVRTYQAYSHYWAGAQEKILLASRPDFTAYPAGSGPYGVFHNDRVLPRSKK
jgi:RHS repeat-associated protein